MGVRPSETDAEPRVFGEPANVDLTMLVLNAFGVPQLAAGAGDPPLEPLDCWLLSSNLSFTAVGERDPPLFDRLQRLSDTELGTLLNCTNEYIGFSSNLSNVSAVVDSTDGADDDASAPVVVTYWALLLLIFPVLTALGNSLVVLSVFREKSIRTPTNYFVVSLACADIMVGVLVMPFAALLEFYGKWAFNVTLCDAWVALDVLNSTASILSLTAISIDRYVAVTQPIRYAQQENYKRTVIMIIFSWLVSIAVAVPLVLGANDVENRPADNCMINSPDFLIFSSIASFYIPLVVLVCLYYRIFKAIHERTRRMRNRASKPRAVLKIMNNGDRSRSRSHRCTHSSSRKSFPTRNGNGNGNGNGDTMTRVDSEENSPEHSRLNDNATRLLSSCQGSPRVYPNSIESHSLMDTISEDPTPQPIRFKNRVDRSIMQTKAESSALLNGTSHDISDSTDALDIDTPDDNDQDLTPNATKSKFKVLKSRFANKKKQQHQESIYHNKRESASARRERKATFTLAVVLLAFLLTWLPFFILNMLCAINEKFGLKIDSCSSSSLISMLTWLGYLSSTINPVIYSYNSEFRKAYRKILTCSRGQRTTKRW